MSNLKRYAHYLIIVGLAMLLIAVAQLGGGDAVWADNNNQGTLPQPTSPSGGGGGGGGGGAASKIIGTVTDLSTGKAGAGITVRINNDEVRTDTFGDYSLSGLAAGEYVVSLVLSGNAVSAQEPVRVQVNGGNEVVANLDYYSVPPPGGVPTKQATTVASSPTLTATAQATPQPVATEAAPSQVAQTAGKAPATLPVTGEQAAQEWWFFLVAGLSLLAIGIKLSVRVKA